MARTKQPQKMTTGPHPSSSTQPQQAPPQQAQQTPAPQQTQQLNHQIDDEVIFLGIRRPGVEGLFQEPIPRRGKTLK